MKSPIDRRVACASPNGQCSKRLSIAEAAEMAFARDGFAGASIDAIAAAAGVSRQTVYNHFGDKETLFVAVVQAMTDRTNAGLFHMIATFPDRPVDLEAELVDFAERLIANCICNRDGKALRRLIEAEGERYPELFETWREHGPGKAWALIGAKLARLANGGLLVIDDPDLAARQFLSLAYSDIQMITLLGGIPTNEQIAGAARNAVRTFMRAFGAARDARRGSMASIRPAMMTE